MESTTTTRARTRLRRRGRKRDRTRRTTSRELRRPRRRCCAAGATVVSGGHWRRRNTAVPAAIAARVAMAVVNRARAGSEVTLAGVLLHRLVDQVVDAALKLARHLFERVPQHVSTLERSRTLLVRIRAHPATTSLGRYRTEAQNTHSIADRTPAPPKFASLPEIRGVSITSSSTVRRRASPARRRW